MDKNSRDSSAWAITAFMCGILSVPCTLLVGLCIVRPPDVQPVLPGGDLLAFFSGPVLAVLGICAARQVFRQHVGGRRLAVAGLVLSLAAVACLVALFCHVFARAYRKAGQTDCKCNLEQLTLAMQLYSADYDEHLPPAHRWPETLFPYVRNEDIFRCRGDWWRRGHGSDGLPTSYTMAEALDGADHGSIQHREQIGLLFDGTKVCGSHQAAAFRHLHGLNVGYVDGHVRWVAEEEFARVRLAP